MITVCLCPCRTCADGSFQIDAFELTLRDNAANYRRSCRLGFETDVNYFCFRVETGREGSAAEDFPAATMTYALLSFREAVFAAAMGRQGQAKHRASADLTGIIDGASMRGNDLPDN